MSSRKNNEIYGVIGFPVGHSLSPVMHNAAFKASGIRAFYKVFETEEPDDIIRNMSGLGISGLSVTIPYKSRLLALLDYVSPEAARIGAVNTILNRGGRLEGFNTDAEGFLAALKQGGVLGPCRVLILGSGGSARAIAFSLVSMGFKITIASRNEETGVVLARDLGCCFAPLSKIHMMEAELLINTTPVGMAPDNALCPVPPVCLKKGMTVFDIIYNPLRTRLMELAEEAGCQTIGGLEMFIRQGASQFALWTGLEPPVRVMRDAVMAALIGSQRPTGHKEEV